MSVAEDEIRAFWFSWFPAVLASNIICTQRSGAVFLLCLLNSDMEITALRVETKAMLTHAEFHNELRQNRGLGWFQSWQGTSKIFWQMRGCVRELGWIRTKASQVHERTERFFSPVIHWKFKSHLWFPCQEVLQPWVDCFHWWGTHYLMKQTMLWSRVRELWPVSQIWPMACFVWPISKEWLLHFKRKTKRMHDRDHMQWPKKPNIFPDLFQKKFAAPTSVPQFWHLEEGRMR